MPWCFISISLTTCGRSVSCYGYQIYGHSCFVKTCKCNNVYASFDLWMSRGSINTFALIMNYLSKNWESMNVNVGMFEVNETTDSCMASQLQSLFEKFGLIHRVLAFVKYEGSNLASMATTWHSIINCELLNLPHVLWRHLFWSCVV